MKHTKKKRVLALVLCMVLVLSTAVAAFANEDVTLTKVSLPGTTLMQTITNADGEEITVTAEVPTGAFTANTSNADITMEVKTVSDESAVLDLVEKKMQGDSDSEYQIENYEMQEVTFYVNNVEQIPEQPITFHVRGTSLDTENVIAFADNTSNEPTMMSTSVDSNSGIQFTAEVSNAESIIYGVFEKAKEVAYEQTYSDDQVEIKVTAASGVLPENATLQVTPVVKTEVTDQMTAEEKQSAEEINAKYETTEQKLNEKATSESYNIAGFLAYDISFTDGDGNKIEPTGDVNVSMSYKEATIPEGAQAAIDEQTEDADLNVTVMHLEENENGEVANVVDMVADENETASVETTDSQSVEKAEFVSDSFSTFTIAWTYSENKSWGGSLFSASQSLQVNVVNQKGTGIGSNKTSSVVGGSYTYTTSGSGWDTTYSLTGEKIEASDVAPEIGSYNYQKCVVGTSVDAGTKALYLRCTATGTKKRGGSIDISSYAWQYSNNGSNWTDVGSNQVYFVYSLKKIGLYIEDNLAATGDLAGTLAAVYVPTKDSDDQISSENVTSVEWYSSETGSGYYQEDSEGIYSGTWTKVEQINYVGDRSNLSGDKGEYLLPAYDQSTDKTVRKWYQVKITLTNGTVIWSDPYQVPYYNSLQNGSFETPDNSKNTGVEYTNQWSSETYLANGGVWKTTGKGSGDKKGKDIEIVNPVVNYSMAKGYSWNTSDWNYKEGNETKTKAPADGNQFAELNCEAAGALYQDVLTTPGQTLSYYLSHRARGYDSTKTQYDTMFLVIAPLSETNDLTTQSALNNYVNGKVANATTQCSTNAEENEIIYNQDGVLIMRITSDNQDWHEVAGANYVPTSSVTRFFFMAGSTSYERDKVTGNMTIGNFLDKVGFSQDLPPVSDDEFTIELDKKFEGLSSDQIADVVKQMSFTVTVIDDESRENLSAEEIENLMGIKNATISGTEMTQQADGSLKYTGILKKEIKKGKTYTVTITENNADVSGYDLTSSAESKITVGDTEETEKGATFTLQGKTTAIVTFTNTYKGANSKNVNFTKVWDDNDDAYNTRPDSLTVTLKASYTTWDENKNVTHELDENALKALGFEGNMSQTLTSKNDWKCTWVVPVYYTYENGGEIKIDYTVEEGENTSNYVYTSPSNGIAVKAESSAETGYESVDWSNLGVVKYNLTTTTSNSSGSSETGISTASVDDKSSGTSTTIFEKLKSKVVNLFSKLSIATASNDSEDSNGNDSKSTLGTPSHNKYITYNSDTQDYTLNLDVTGAEGDSEGVDVLFVIDTSGSMGQGRGSTYCNLLPTVKNLLNGESGSTGVVDTILNANSKNSVAFVSFAGKDETTTTGWYTSSNSQLFKNKISALKATGGTNWTYAMQQAESVLKEKSSSTNKKVVIFLSDGQPTFTMNGNSETGWGSRTEESYYTDAIAAVTGSTYLKKVDNFYSVYLTSGTKTGMQKFSDGIGETVTAAECLDGSNGKLSTTLESIMNSVIPTYNNVVITDVLSDYVDFKSGDDTQVTVTKTDSSGTVTQLGANDYTAEVSEKTVTVKINGVLETGATYTASFDVVPSEAANEYYEKNGSYPNEGDKSTGKTSAGRKGFYSNDNDSTKLSYQITGDTEGKTYTSEYQKPVIQVLNHTLTYTKTWNKPSSVETPSESIKLKVTYTDGTTGEVTLESAQKWRYTESVPLTRNIQSVEEENVPTDYTASYQINGAGDSVTVINNYSKLDEKDITVTKKWENDSESTRENVTVGLYRSVKGSNENATLVSKKTLSKDNDWKATWEKQEISSSLGTDQTEYVYAVREENIPAGYTSSISYDFSGFGSIAVTITNTYDQNCADENYYIANVLQTETLKVEKNWEDNNDALGLRPDSLTVTVNGLDFKLSGENNWTSSQVVPKLKNATDNSNISVSENLAEVDENKNYNQDGSPVITRTSSETDVTVSNKLNSTSIIVKKVWNDGLEDTETVTDATTGEKTEVQNHDYVKFKLMYKSGDSEWKQYGGNDKTYIINADSTPGSGNEDDSTWSVVIDNLPASYEYKVVEVDYGAGGKDYTISETSNGGKYVVSYDQDSSKGTYTITNTLNWSAVKMSQNWDEDAPDENSVGLTGAEFELRNSNNTVIATGTSGSDGTVTWTAKEYTSNSSETDTYNLSTLNGKYTIVEIKAPTGYNLNSTPWTLKFENGLLTTFNGESVTGTTDNGVVIKLGNKKLYSLPSTGGKGIFLFTIGGMLLMGGAAWIMCRNRRREVLEK